MEVISLSDRRKSAQVIIPDAEAKALVEPPRQTIKSSIVVTRMPWEDSINPVDPRHAKDVRKALEHSNANFQVYLDRLMTGDGIIVPSKAVRRADNGKLLAVVGKNFTPLQNERAFDFFQPILDNSDAILVNAGTVYEGKKASIIVKMPGESMKADIGKGDIIETYLKLTNSHDGNSALKIDFLPLRLVCLNGMATLSGGSNLLKTRHTKAIGARLDNVSDIIRRITDDFREVATLFQTLQAKEVKTEAEFRAYAAKALGVVVDSEKVTQCWLNMHMAPGAAEAGMTYWGAYNAVNYHLQYQAKEDKKKGMESLLYGHGDVMNRRALALALAA